MLSSITHLIVNTVKQSFSFWIMIGWTDELPRIFGRRRIGLHLKVKKVKLSDGKQTSKIGEMCIWAECIQSTLFNGKKWLDQFCDYFIPRRIEGGGFSQCLHKYTCFNNCCKILKWISIIEQIYFRWSILRWFHCLNDSWYNFESWILFEYFVQIFLKMLE